VSKVGAAWHVQVTPKSQRCLGWERHIAGEEEKPERWGWGRAEPVDHHSGGQTSISLE
jgi:hypothetical protein